MLLVTPGLSVFQIEQLLSCICDQKTLGEVMEKDCCILEHNNEDAVDCSK